MWIVVRARVPWWAKAASKLLLSRIGMPEAVWRRLGIFQRGSMLDPDYAVNVFERHFGPVRCHLPPGFSVLELGPGDSLATAAVARASGASETWLVDTGDFASRDIRAYRQLLRRLARDPAETPEYVSVDSMLQHAKARYLTEGLASLRSIPGDSVDFVFSQAVLEHIPLAQFEATVAELYRIQRAGGVSSHRVDLQDHLQHSLNSLRFSSTLWESRWFASSGFYTNRLRAGQIRQVFADLGFRSLDVRLDRWEELPVPRRSMAAEFARLPDEELLVRGMDLVCQK